MSLELTAEQSSAILKIKAWRDDGYPGGVFRLTGYAGTGKTTLLKEAQNLFRNPIVTTLTGKAASVLRSKGLSQAVNIHQLIYQFQGYDAKKKKLIFADNGNPLRSADVIFLDEASMIDKKTAEDILRRGVPVLAAGDPGQLQPVSGPSWFAGTPDAHLDTITRQAADSPIIRAAHLIRKNEIKAGLALVPFRDAKCVSADEVFAYDQVLVGTHPTRKKVITSARKRLGYPPDVPVAGDKVVCLRNNKHDGLYNGDLFLVEGADRFQEGVCRLNLQDFGTTYAYLDGLREQGQQPFDRRVNLFGYSYALTVHKAQGSEWDSVAVKLDWPGGDFDKWLYTAVTRARHDLLVLK